jgi:hypothetical protein
MSNTERSCLAALAFLASLWTTIAAVGDTLPMTYDGNQFSGRRGLDALLL